MLDVCFGYLCLTRLMFDTQFGRMEVGVCGRRGRRALWPVERDRSPEYDTAMLPCHSWGAKTAKEAGERLSAALPSHVPVRTFFFLLARKSRIDYRLPNFIMPNSSLKATFPMCFGLTSCLSVRKCWLKSAQYVFSCGIKFQASDSPAAILIWDFKCWHVFI